MTDDFADARRLGMAVMSNDAGLATLMADLREHFREMDALDRQLKTDLQEIETSYDKFLATVDAEMQDYSRRLDLCQQLVDIANRSGSEALIARATQVLVAAVADRPRPMKAAADFVAARVSTRKLLG